MPPMQPGSIERAPRRRTGFDAADRTGDAFAALARQERALAAADLARRRGSTAPANHLAPLGRALWRVGVPDGMPTALHASARRVVHLLARRTGATRPT
jgi:hypothetical protein